VVESKGVPGKPPARLQRRRDSVEGPTSIGPRREVQERPKRAVDQRGRLLEPEVAMSPSRRSSSTPAAAETELVWAWLRQSGRGRCGWAGFVSFRLEMLTDLLHRRSPMSSAEIQQRDRLGGLIRKYH
jgi:hypothetical protein